MAFFIGGLCLSPIYLPAPQKNIVIKDENNLLIQIIPVFQKKYENKSEFLKMCESLWDAFEEDHKTIDGTL